MEVPHRGLGWDMRRVRDAFCTSSRQLRNRAQREDLMRNSQIGNIVLAFWIPGLERRVQQPGWLSQHHEEEQQQNLGSYSDLFLEGIKQSRHLSGQGTHWMVLLPRWLGQKHRVVPDSPDGRGMAEG